jgi:hypothetical protein
MTDRSVAVEPYLPQANIAQIRDLFERGMIVSLDGEVLPASDADNDSLVSWILAAEMLRKLAYEMRTMAESEMLHRVRETAGPIKTPYGVARESISRGTVSGVNAKRIRDILEARASDSAIPWDAVDNIAPLAPHVTPARVADYLETIEGSMPDLADELRAHLPERRRTLKVDAAEA